MSTKAVLKPTESQYINGFGPVNPNTQFDFEYDENDNFYIKINDKKLEDVSTAFDFITV